jgi:predicted kinase
MGTTRLILIEGMIGAGKSTTAQHIGTWLAERGDDSVVFAEFAPDHPVRTKAVDRLRAAYPEPVWTQHDVGPDGLSVDPTVYSAEQWGRLAELCARDGRTVVLESTFLQNSVLPAFVNGAPPAKVLELIDRVEAAIAPAEPLLVYLRPTDIQAAISHVHATRDPVWTAWNIESAQSYPFALARGLRGRDAVVGLYEEWERVVDGVLARWPYRSLLVLDPQQDWPAALRSIEAAIDA